jgi:hypothetical protein
LHVRGNNGNHGMKTIAATTITSNISFDRRIT